MRVVGPADLDLGRGIPVRLDAEPKLRLGSGRLMGAVVRTGHAAFVAPLPLTITVTVVLAWGAALLGVLHLRVLRDAGGCWGMPASKTGLVEW